MPPTRALATDLGLSRGVVVEAYQQLVAEGYLVSRAGGYTQVADVGRGRAPAGSQSTAQSGRQRIDFKYGRPDVSQFPRAAWLRSIRRVLNETPHRAVRLPRRPRRARTAARAGRLPQPGPRHVGRAREHGDLQRFRAGIAVAAPGARPPPGSGGSRSRTRRDDDAPGGRGRGRARGGRRTGAGVRASTSTPSSSPGADAVLVTAVAPVADRRR